MRSAVFCMHTGLAGNGTVRKLVELFLVPMGWTVSDDTEPSLHGAYDEYNAVMPGLDRRHLMYVNATRGLIETNSAFIKNFSQHAAVKFKKDLRLIHLVREPLGYARSMANRGAFPLMEGEQSKFHIRRGYHVALRQEWSPFQRNLWEWVECQIRSILMGQQLSEDKVFRINLEELVAPDMSGAKRLLKWIDSEFDDSSITAQDIADCDLSEQTKATEQDIVESYSWINGVADREKRMIVMAFRELKRLKLLPNPPAFVAKLV